MSGSFATSDILVVVDRGDQYNVNVQPPDNYGISIQSGDTYVVNIDLPTTIVNTNTTTYYRVAEYATLAATASFFGGASASVNWPNIINKPTGLVSSSTQVSYTDINNIPPGILSSSTQINQLSNVSASFATTASYALNAGFGSGFPFSGSAVITGSLLVSGGAIVGTSSLAQQVLGGKSRYIPLWTGSSQNELTSSIMYQTNKGIFIGYDTTAHFHSAEGETLAVHSGETGVKNVIYAHGTIDNDYRINLRNISSGPSASTNFKATSDVGNDIGGFVEMGINSSTYSRTDQIGGPLDAYLFTTGSDLLIGTLSPNKRIILFTGPGDADSNARVYVDASGSVAINTAVVDPTNPEALLVTAIAESYNLISGKANINNYAQLNIINENGGASASADVVATANNGTETSNYIDMGINSDQYGLPNLVGGPNDAYLYSTGNMLHIGNATEGQHVMFFAGGLDAEANNKLTLDANNQHTLSGSLNVTGSVNVLQGVVNNLTASFALTASYVSGAASTWDDIANKPANLVSSSQQATSWTVLSASFASTASSINFTPATASFATSASFAPTKAGIISSSTQVNYTQLQNIPSGIVSSSAQINTGSFTGTFFGTSSWANNSTSASFALTASYVSGAASSWNEISNKPTGLVSSSTQINTGSFSGSFTGTFSGTSSWANNVISSSFATTASAATSITFTPASASYAPTNAGVVSSSTQIDYTQIQNKPTVIATASYIEYNNVANKPSLISASTQVNYPDLQNIPVGLVSSSTQINTGSFTGTFVGTSSWATNAITASNILGGEDKYIPLWNGTNALTSSLLYQTASSILLGATEQHTPEAPDRFGVFAGITDSYNLISAHGEIDNYLQLNIKNFSNQSNASSDIVATADIGTEVGGFINLGINNSNYNIPNAIGNALDAYLYSTGSDLLIGNISSGKKVILFNGEGSALDNARVYIDSIGTVSINTGSATPGNPEALLVKAIAFSYNMITAQADINNYAQVNIINKNSGNFASSDFVATANNGNEEQYYISMGINSENFTGDVGLANDAYLYTTGSNLLVGNIAPDKKLILFAGDVDTAASAKLVISPDNEHQITGSLNVSGSITTLSTVVNQLTASNAVSSSYAISASYAPLILPPNIISSSLQINTGSFSGSFTGNVIGTSSWASNAISSSFATTASAATSITFVPSTASFASTSSAATSITFTPTTASFATTASAATSITFTPSSASFAITASYAPLILPSGVVSSSTQIVAGLPIGTVSSSAQVNYTQLQNIPNGIVSSSAQVTTLLPSGVVSSSLQVNTGSFSGSFIGDGSQLTGVVASGVAVVIADDSVVQGNAGQLNFGNLVTATVASNTASINVTLPVGLVSSSAQINTGSFSGSFTGNVIGTSSWATNAITASYALNASSGGGSSAVTIDTYTFDADGSTLNYVVSQSYDASSLFVMVNGLGYTNPTDYTISSNTITFTVAPVSSSYIVIRALTNVSSNVTGSFSGSFFGAIQSSSYATTASFAVSASWAPGGGAGSNNWNDLINVPSGLVSSSTQASAWTVASSSVAVSASYAPTILPVGVVSSSTQVNYTQLQNIPSGIVSGSSQVVTLLPTGTVSSSLQINTGSFSGSFVGAFAGTSSWANNAISSSFATTSSAATSITFVPSTASFAITASAATTITFTPATASFATTASTATSITFTPSTASFATTASAATSITFTPSTASYAISSSTAVTANFATSASWAPTVAGAMVPVLDEGVVAVSTPLALNFVGAGVTVTNTSNTASITIPGGSGGDIAAKIVSASYTFGAANEFIFTTGSFTVNVPSAVGIIGRQYQIKNISTGVIFITGSSTIDDYSDITITEKNTSLGLISNGISWSIF